MKICPMCGQPLGEFDRFCGGCGHSLETAKAVITQKHHSIAYKTEDLEKIVQKPKRIATAKKPKTYILPIFTAVSVAVLATAAILLIPKLSKDESPKQVVQTVEQTTADTPAAVPTSGQCSEQAQWNPSSETDVPTTVETEEPDPAPAAGGVSTPSAPTPDATQFSEYCVDLYLSSGILSWNVGTADVPAYEGIRLSSGCTVRIAGTLIDGESGFHTYRASVGSVDGLMIAVDYDGDDYYDLIEIM